LPSIMRNDANSPCRLTEINFDTDEFFFGAEHRMY
jgi:hypothetical protein